MAVCVRLCTYVHELQVCACMCVCAYIAYMYIASYVCACSMYVCACIACMYFLNDIFYIHTHTCIYIFIRTCTYTTYSEFVCACIFLKYKHTSNMIFSRWCTYAHADHRWVLTKLCRLQLITEWIPYCRSLGRADRCSIINYICSLSSPFPWSLSATHALSFFHPSRKDVENGRRICIKDARRGCR